MTIEHRTAKPLLCRIFGHRWRITHVLHGQRTGTRKDQWMYYSHQCKRCFHEEYRNPWPM